MEVKKRFPVLILLLLTLGLLPAAAAAQSAPTRSKPWFVPLAHYGKWVTLAGAAALLTQGALRHGDANDDYDVLIRRCRDAPVLCDKQASGAYVDPGSEALYQRTIVLDQTARNWIVAGEVSLLLSGTMF